jgi:osmotically-inducible protein OsmY
MTSLKSQLQNSIHRGVLLFALLGTVVALPGCAFFLIGSAVSTTAVVASDRRTVGEQVTDKEIELKSANDMRVNFGETANITSTSYLTVVLLTGEVFSEDISKKATELAAAVPQVTKVINQLYIGPLSSFGQIASDTWLASKIRTTLIATAGIPSGAILDVVQRNNVYLMGLVTQAEADTVNRTVSKIGGVKEVFPFYQIMTPEQAKELA